MTPRTESLERLDAILQDWTRHGLPESGILKWLIPQTFYTKDSRRLLIRSLSQRSGVDCSPALDAGCGIGAMTLELAALTGASVTGLDLDRQALNRARHLGLASGINAAWVEGDLTAMPFPDGHFRSVWTRLVFQHLPDPEAALRECHRVLEPGGVLVTMDVDDGFLVEDPPPPPEWDHLVEAFRALQQNRGGDRRIGRRLPGLMARSGFHVQMTEVQVGGFYHHRSLQDIGWQFDRLRMLEERSALLSSGLITPEEWERGWERREATWESWAFETSALCIVIGMKPFPAANAPTPERDR